MKSHELVMGIEKMCTSKTGTWSQEGCPLYKLEGGARAQYSLWAKSFWQMT